MTQVTWHISSYSGDNDNCVEVAVYDVALPGVIRVRDSKDRDVPEVQMSSSAWRCFVQHVGLG
ncbi:DUF397 domain-containing protein [Streptomyces sp. NPDC005955]|uniref:DUF397 domain-containing protein n=1 Tax=Streptomyces sp. NPDC005955 TaxID=3364738 RepID=UPI00369EF15C